MSASVGHTAVTATPQGTSKQQDAFSPASTSTPQGLSPTASSAPGTQRRSPSPVSVSEDRDTMASPGIALGLTSEAAQVPPTAPRRLCCLCEDDYHSYAHCPEFTGKEVCLSIVNAPLPATNNTPEQHPYFRSYLIMMADAWQSVTLGDVHAFLQSATVQVLLRDVPDAENIEAFLSKHYSENSNTRRQTSNVSATTAHRIRTVVSSLGQMMQMPLLPPYQEGNGGRPYMMYKGSRFSQCTIADRTPLSTPCYALHISPGGCVDLMLSSDAASRLYSMLGNVQQLLQDLEWQLSLLRPTNDAPEEQQPSSSASHRFAPPPPLVVPPLPQQSPRDSRSGSVSPTAPSFSSLLSSTTGSPLLPPTSSPMYPPCESRPYLSMRRDHSGVLLPPAPVPYDAAALASATLPPMVLQWLSSVLRENRAAMEAYHQMRAAGYDGSEGYIPPQYMPQPQPQEYNVPYQYPYQGNVAAPWPPQYPSPPQLQQGANLMPLRGRAVHQEPSHVATPAGVTQPTPVAVAVPPVDVPSSTEQKEAESTAVHTPPVAVVPMAAPSTATRRLNYSTPTANASPERCPRPLAQEKEEDTSVLTQLTTATDVSILSPEPVAATTPQPQTESHNRSDATEASQLCAKVMSTAEVLAQMVGGRVTREVSSGAYAPSAVATTVNVIQPTTAPQNVKESEKPIENKTSAVSYSKAALARYPYIFDLSSSCEALDSSTEYKATVPNIAVLLPILRHAVLLFLPFSVRCDQWIRGAVFNYTRLAKSLSDVRDKVSHCTSAIELLNEETPRFLHPRALPLPDPMYLCQAENDTISGDPVIGSTITGVIQPKKLKAVAYRLALGSYAAKNSRMICTLIQRRGKRFVKGSDGDTDTVRSLQKFLPLNQRLSRHRTECTIHISFLPLDMPNFVLRMLLDCCGLVLAVRLVACGKRAATGTASADSEAFKMAFVEFSSPQEAQRALQLLHGLRANRLRLRVEAACHSITGCRAEDAMVFLADEEEKAGISDSAEKEEDQNGMFVSCTTEESSETLTEKSTIESPVSAPSAALPCRPGRSVERVVDAQTTTTTDIILDEKVRPYTETTNTNRSDDNDEDDEPSTSNNKTPLPPRRPTSFDTYLRTPVQIPYRFKHNLYALESSEYNLACCSEGLESYSAPTEEHDTKKNDGEHGAALYDATCFYHAPDEFPSCTQVEAQQQEWERNNLSNPLGQTGASKKRNSKRKENTSTVTASTVAAWVHWCSFGLSYEDMAVAAVAMVELSEHYKGLREEVERRLAESDCSDVIDPDRNALSAAEDFEQIKPKEQIQQEESEMRARRRTDALVTDTEDDGPDDNRCISFFLKAFRSAQSFDNFLQNTDSPSSTGITCTVQEKTVKKEVKVIQKTFVAKTSDPLPSLHSRRRSRRKTSAEAPVEMSGTVTNEVTTDTTTTTITTTAIHTLLRRYHLSDVTEEEVRHHFGQLLRHHPRVTLLQETAEETNNDAQQKGWRQIYCELRCKMSAATEQQMHQFLDRVLVVSLRTLRSSWGMLADTVGYRGYYAGRSVVLSVTTKDTLMSLCNGNYVWQPETEENEGPGTNAEQQGGATQEVENCPVSADEHREHPPDDRQTQCMGEAEQANISVVSSIRPSGDTEHSLLDTLENNDIAREGKPSEVSSPWTKAHSLCRVDEEEAAASRLDAIANAVRLCYGATLVDTSIQKALALDGDNKDAVQSRLLPLLPERSLLHIASAVLSAYDDVVTAAKRAAIDQVRSAIAASGESHETTAVANPDDGHNKSCADHSVNTTGCESSDAAAARRAEQLCRKLRSLTDPRVTTNVTYTTTQVLPASTAPARSVLRMMQLHRHKPLSGYVAAVSVHACLLLHTAFTEYEQYGNDKGYVDESRHHVSDDFASEDAMTMLSNTVTDLVHYIHTSLQQRFVVLHFAKQMSEEEGATTTTAEQRAVLSTMLKYAVREARVLLSNLLQLGMLLEEQAPHLAAEVYGCVWSGVEVLGPIVFSDSPTNNALSRSVLETLCEHCALGRLWLSMRSSNNNMNTNSTVQSFLAQEVPQFPLQAFLTPQSDILPTSYIEQILREWGINF